MTRSRSELHLTKIDEFAAFCESLGYRRGSPLTSACEVLRMTKPGAQPIIVHCRDRAKEHATTWGESDRLLRRWFQRRKNERANGTAP